MTIHKVSVIGAGQMGKQIALLTAMRGFDVVLFDAFEKALSKAEVWAKSYVDERVSKGKLTEDQAKDAQSHLSFERDLKAAVSEADLVIEAIVEQEDAKRTLFKQLDDFCKPEAILTSNSSFIPTSAISEGIQRGARMANLHYFNPALVMKLVEVVQGPQTSPETIETLMAFCRACGKEPIHVKKEIDGFVANRIYSRIVQEAYFLVENGYVTAPEVDTAVEKGLNHPMGPFRLMDLVGLDVAYMAKERKFEQTGLEEDRPPKALEDLYKQGHYGKKTGKGWYDYSK